jgi:cold shock CspA family protein
MNHRNRIREGVMAATYPLSELTAERLSAERVTATGTIKWVNLEDGCGMVGPDEGDDDLTFRFADSGSAPLRAGARVEFEVDLGCHGLEAFNVTLT